MCHLPEAGVLLDAMCASNGGPFADIHDLYLHSMVPMAWMRGGEDAREDPPPFLRRRRPHPLQHLFRGEEKTTSRERRLFRGGEEKAFSRVSSRS